MPESRETPSPISPSPFQPLDQAPTIVAGRSHPLRWLLGGSAAVFLAIMVFLFSARSLHVDVTAESTVQVSVSGLAMPFGKRYLLLPGSYTVDISAAGYHPQSVAVEIDHRDNQTLELMLDPLPGLLTVDSTPTHSEVFIDGQSVGQTPLDQLAIEAGEHLLQLRAARYQTLEQTLEISGREIHQQLSLPLTPDWAEYSIASQPPGATILVDTKPLGRTPAVVEILSGERQLTLQLNGYASVQQALVVEAGQPRDLGELRLEPAAGSLALESTPAGANVTLNGEFQGQTPLTLALNPDREHQLAVFKPGYRQYSDTLRLPAAGTQSLRIDLTPIVGRVRFDIKPAGANLRINGKLQPGGTDSVSLNAVEHTIEVSLPGYATQRHRLTPRPGLEQLVSIQLLTEKQALMARIPAEITTSLGQTLRLFIPAESELADFSLGASRRESGRGADEVLRPVSLRRMFYLQTTEVTNNQFRQFLASHDSGQVSGKSLNREQQPAAQVNWQQAVAFCNWLSAREGLPLFYRETGGLIKGFNPKSTGYRLPTEAEWAWAARRRGNKLLKYTWGDQFPPQRVVENYADKSSAYITGRVLPNYDDGHAVSAPVATYLPNANGLYDMGGNVAEWIHDVYHIPTANVAATIDPLGSQTGDNYVIRGASWAQGKLADLRLSNRDYGQLGRDDVGFRLARYAQ